MADRSALRVDADALRSLVEEKDPALAEDDMFYKMKRENDFGIKLWEEVDMVRVSWNILTTGFLPWLPFAVCSYVMHDKLAYKSSGAAWGAWFGVLALILVLCLLRRWNILRLWLVLAKKPKNKAKNEEESDDDSDERHIEDPIVAAEMKRMMPRFVYPNLTVREQEQMKHARYQLLMLLISWFAGVVFGQWLYSEFARDYYEYEQLKWVNGAVNPLLQKSETFTDVGVIRFSPDSYIDRAHTGCFYSRNVFCVAPIVQGESLDAAKAHMLPISPTGKYSFFAVGRDCCSCPSTTDFECGDYGFNSGQGGLRALRKEDRAGYLLAAQQWAATNRADIGETPLFFEWVSNPFRDINMLRTQYQNWFALGNVLALCFLVSASIFAKLMKLS